MLVVVIRGGYVVECRKIALTRDFSTLRSSGLSSFGVGCCGLGLAVCNVCCAIAGEDLLLSYYSIFVV